MSPSKLGNFTDISAFVIIGCLHEIFESEAFYFRPLLTVPELLCVLGARSFWDDPYFISDDEISSFFEKSPLIGSSSPAESQTLIDVNSNFSFSSFSTRQYRGLQPVEVYDHLVHEGRNGTPKNYT